MLSEKLAAYGSTVALLKPFYSILNCSIKSVNLRDKEKKVVINVVLEGNSKRITQVNIILTRKALCDCTELKAPFLSLLR